MVRRGRKPCCEKVGLNKGSWTEEEDLRLIAYINKHGPGNWRALPKLAGLLRCGKSCRLRWINYLRPDIKRGNFTKEEEDTIIRLHKLLGNKWSKIASCLPPGRTDNEIKNVWHTHLKKRLAAAPTEQQHSTTEPIEKSEHSQASSSSSSSSSSSAYHSCSDHSEGQLPDLFDGIPLEMGDDIDISAALQEQEKVDLLALISPSSSSSDLLEMNRVVGGTQPEPMILLGEKDEWGQDKSTRWLEYLEKELGLKRDGDEQMETWSGIEEEDPVSSYFQWELKFHNPPPLPSSFI